MNKAAREQVLEVVDQYFGKDSATYGCCTDMFSKGRTPGEVILWLQTLRQASQSSNDTRAAAALAKGEGKV